MNKTFYIETFGCQMNKCDSELMAFSLKESGFSESDSAMNADVLVYNTCSVRQHAEDRVNARIKSTKKRMKRDSIIVLTGCMAQRIGEAVIKENVVDLVIGPYQSPGLGNIVTAFMNNRKHNLFVSQESVDFEKRVNPDFAGSKKDLSWHEWVTITHGCENFCSYCIVPYVRGKLVSFPSDSIVDYIGILTDNGVKEITLLGQNVNQYGTDNSEIPFYKLLENVSKIDKIIRINFITSHPKDFDENIIRVINDYENITNSIHLPLQSGSDRVLELMNRKYSMSHYMKIIENIDKILDNYSISTDLIVGFPGETDEDYQATLDAVKTIRFDDAYTYAYSPREGTSAYDIEEGISRDEKIDRLNLLIETQRGIASDKLSTRISCIEEMIVEKISKKSENEVMGKTYLNHPIITPGNRSDIGKKLKVKITDVKGSTLYGKRVN